VEVRVPGWVLYGVLYLLFAGVVLWLATEALFQHGAPLVFRFLALCGFCGLWAGIVLKTNTLIYGGLAVFVIAQAVVSTYVRRGAHRAWALGGGKGRRGRRGGSAQEPAVRSDGVFGAEAEAAPVAAFAGPDEFGDYEAYPEAGEEPGEAGFDLQDQGDEPAFGVGVGPDSVPHAESNADFDTQVGMAFGGFGPGFVPEAVPAQGGPAPGEHLADPSETPVISPFVDDAYAQEIVAEYASGEAHDLSSATESTAQFPRPFTDMPSAHASDAYQQGYPSPQPPAMPAMPPAGPGFGPPAGQPPMGPPGGDGTWLDSYVSPREAAARRDSGPVESTSSVPRGPSPWDTYERRVRLPESAPHVPEQPAQPGPTQPGPMQSGPMQAGGPPAGGEHWASDRLGYAQQESGPGPGGPAPWARMPEQPQPGPAVPRQPEAPPGPTGGSVSWGGRDVRSSETLIGQIVSDEDLSFGDQWADEPEPSFGDRPYPRQPMAGETANPPQAPGPETGWPAQGGGFVDPEAGEARHGAGRHGRGKRRGRH
jgi:hypothetical protein